MKLPYLGLVKKSSLTGRTALSLLHIINITIGSLASIYNREEAPLSLNKHQVPPTDLIKAPPEEGDLLGKSGADFEWALKWRTVRAYEGFLEGPVLGVIVAMWLAGVTLMGLGVASLYLLWASLRMLITGV